MTFGLYWVRLKGSYVVARIFFLILLNCSACPAWVLLSQTIKPFRPTQYNSQRRKMIGGEDVCVGVALRSHTLR